MVPRTASTLRHRLKRIWRHTHTAAGRFAVAAFAAGLCWGALSVTSLGFTVNVMITSSVWSYSMLGLAWSRIATNGPRETQLRAATEDPGRPTVHAVVLLSSIIYMIGVFLLLHEITFDKLRQHALLWIVVCLSATVGAWLLNHTSWTLRYAHLYYRDHGAGVGGLSFPGDEPPDDWDFAYFAFAIGMCFQVSDVTITDRVIRRAALVHALQSFGFNTTIVALTLNVTYSLLT